MGVVLTAAGVVDLLELRLRGDRLFLVRWDEHERGRVRQQLKRTRKAVGIGVLAGWAAGLGAARDARGQAVADYVLVVFPEDAKLWGPQSRFVQTTRPNQNGTFSIKGLPPGRYLAAVVPALENGLQNDPAVLEQLRPRARGFSLTEGQMLNLNLDIAAQ